jgi:hypothetical protein
MMLWQRTRPLRQVQELNSVMILLNPNHLLDDVDINRWMSYVHIFKDYLNIVLLNYFLFSLHVYMFLFCILEAACD